VGGPIEQVVIIVEDNHTFDSYLGAFRGANGTALPAAPDPQRNAAAGQAADPAHAMSVRLP
jgi:phospholipase C